MHSGVATLGTALADGNLKGTRKPDNARLQARFVREGETTAPFAHPGIVKVHSAGEASGTVMSSPRRPPVDVFAHAERRPCST